MARDAGTDHDPGAGPDNGSGPAVERPAAAHRRRAVLPIVGVIGVVVVLLLGIGIVRGVTGWWPGWLPGLSNPFEQETTDRSGPVLLESVQDLSRYTAASGNFELIIDVETGRRFIPDVLVGERILFVAAGSVDSYVEFGGLTEGALVVDEENDTVDVNVPAPELTEPNLDHERSYVYAQQRGVGDRIRDFFREDPDTQQELLRLAEERIAEAAAASELRERAEANTRTMLEGMLSSLGFRSVTVTFVSP